MDRNVFFDGTNVNGQNENYSHQSQLPQYQYQIPSNEPNVPQRVDYQSQNHQPNVQPQYQAQYQPQYQPQRQPQRQPQQQPHQQPQQQSQQQFYQPQPQMGYQNFQQQPHQPLNTLGPNGNTNQYQRPPQITPFESSKKRMKNYFDATAVLTGVLGMWQMISGLIFYLFYGFLFHEKVFFLEIVISAIFAIVFGAVALRLFIFTRNEESYTEPHSKTLLWILLITSVLATIFSYVTFHSLPYKTGIAVFVCGFCIHEVDKFILIKKQHDLNHPTPMAI
eukprot:TRINITY_DN3228_c1_g1_i3.p1 TRINITY_DN3228_c1_g1~~TRINITY_DN3228_c1_g1_i3.p1  ORF type:complete len:294 (-),score=71.39 TRINITY_DN3228_c1_g1_i3:631-1464(-)